MARKKPASTVAFFGTSVIAAEVLRRLAPNLPLQLVVTRDIVGDETRRPSTVAEVAVELGLELIRVRDRRDLSAREAIATLAPDLAIAVEYGAALSPEVLGAPDRGVIGLHFSLLPRYRGGEPLRSALAAGETQTGVTTLLVEDADDRGMILVQESLPIAPDENYGALAPRAIELGSQVLLDSVRRYLGAGPKIKPKPQNEKRASRCPRLTRRHRKAPWWLDAQAVYNRLRSYAPKRGLLTWVKASEVEILRGVPLDWYDPPAGDTGTYLGMRTGRIAVLCGEKSAFGIEKLRRKDGTSVPARRFVDEERLSVGMSFV